MNTQFPIAPTGYSSSFFNDLFVLMRRYFTDAVGKDSETPRIVLRSPNGTLYDVTVSDAGALVVTPSEKARV